MFLCCGFTIRTILAVGRHTHTQRILLKPRTLHCLLYMVPRTVAVAHASRSPSMALSGWKKKPSRLLLRGSVPGKSRPMYPNKLLVSGHSQATHHHHAPPVLLRKRAERQCLSGSRANARPGLEDIVSELCAYDVHVAFRLPHECWSTAYRGRFARRDAKTVTVIKDCESKMGLVLRAKLGIELGETGHSFARS